ncbi:hypothetical protein BD289DRAFT_470890 [Coniella lustricola]|uniref:Uncharacterized protein n=1 Tax=Coniella lustricola TaxID=2025994 RepID=A0A2T3AM78_9PEZI|nr:hypothetical protein BD289DRAFT_470890 [Coniella lustricola]
MPDLNTVPESPRILASSRRSSAAQMSTAPASAVGSPPADAAALNILPSNLNAVTTGAPIPPSLPSPHASSTSVTAQPPADAASTISGPGPVRHPRPLTAADLHQQLEKEQEAVVNRLTRELDLLRQAQNASVVSNASSTSASATGAAPEVPIIPDGRQHLLSGSGFSIPLSSGRRHNRSGSSASARSIAATIGSASAAGGPAASTSVVNITAPAPIRPGAVSLSRQNSTQSHSRQSLSSSPAHASSWASSHMADAAHSGYFPHRPPPPGAAGPASIPSATPTPGSEHISPAIMSATSRFEETAFYRHELDSVKRENEGLKRRIRDLERMVRERRASDASNRQRSESVSTTASANVVSTGGASIARPRNERVTSVMSTTGSVTSVAIGVPEEEVKVGESAASSGLRHASATAATLLPTQARQTSHETS